MWNIILGMRDIFDANIYDNYFDDNIGNEPIILNSGVYSTDNSAH